MTKLTEAWVIYSIECGDLYGIHGVYLNESEAEQALSEIKSKCEKVWHFYYMDKVPLNNLRFVHP